MTFATAILALVVGTWNGDWFPSGRAEHRASPEKEEETIALAAKMLASGLKAVDPEGTDEVILCLNEMRSPLVVSNLVSRLGRDGLKTAVVSGYRRRDRFDQQQDAIATTLPVAARGWSVFLRAKKRDETPPRGYAFAAVVSDGGAVTTRVYAVHLKSEYGATTEEKRRLNRVKRGAAIEQIVKMESPPKRRKNVVPSRVVIAGDMNADRWSEYFSQDTFFGVLDEAGFLDVFSGMGREERDTHPSKRWGPSTLDYVFPRGLGAPQKVHIEPTNGASDHNAVFVRF